MSLMAHLRESANSASFVPNDLTLKELGGECLVALHNCTCLGWIAKRLELLLAGHFFVPREHMHRVLSRR